QRGTLGKTRLGAVAEERARPRHLESAPRKMRQRRAPADAAEREHDAQRRKECDLAVEPGAAAQKLFGQRLVGGWSAAARRSDVSAAQLEPVATALAGRLICQAGPVQGGIEKIAAVVSREHPSGAIAAVRRRRPALD